MYKIGIFGDTGMVGQEIVNAAMAAKD